MRLLLRWHHPILLSSTLALTLLQNLCLSASIYQTGY
jgi:hypothetical protein